MLHHLKQFKKIAADPVSRERSRNLILMHPQKAKLTAWQGLLVFARSGTAMASAAVMLVLLGGGFSAMRFVKTAGGLDNETLRAEAQAIDIQIQIANLSYGEVEEKGSEFARNTLRAAVTAPSKATSSDEKVVEPEPGLTIDETLDILSSI